MKKKITALVLSILMVFGMIPVSAFTAFAEGTDSQTEETPAPTLVAPVEISATYDWYNAEATEYEIDSIDDLAGLAKLTQGNVVIDETTTLSKTDFAGKTVRLTANITFTDGQYWYYADGTTTYNYIIKDFAGTFDGNNCTIFNMHYNKSTGSQTLAFFEKIATGGSIENLTIDTVNVTTAGGTFCTVVASLAGAAFNCYAKNITVNSTVAVSVSGFGAISGSADQCIVDGLTMTMTGDVNYGLQGGGFGACNGTVTNCAVKNVNATSYGELKFNGFGAINGTLKSSSVENITLVAKGSRQIKEVSGFGAVAATAYVEDCHVNTLNIKVEGTGSIQKAGGFTYAGRGNFKDCTVNNFNVTAKNSVSQIGGFVNEAYGGSNYENCSVNTVTLNLGDETNPKAATCIGGFIGQSRDGAITVTNCHVNELKMDLNANVGGDTPGGFIAQAAGNTTFTNCSVDGYINAANNTNNNPVGGFAGNFGWGGGSTCTFTNCEADVDITAVGPAGGFMGQVKPQGQSSTTDVTFTECVANGDVTSTNSTAGGFAAIGDSGNFENCIANGNVTGDTAGGFMGAIVPNKNNLSINVSGCEANGAVIGETVASGFVGSVTASAENDTNITNVTIQNSTATSNVKSENGTVVDFATETVPSGSTNHFASSGNTVKFAEDITISIDNSEYVVGENIFVSVNISGDGTFNAAELELEISDILTFNKEDSTLNGATVTVSNGVLKLVDYGEAQSFGNAVYILAFTSTKGGNAEITLISAGFGTVESAESDNLAKADCNGVPISVAIRNGVSLDSIFYGDYSAEYGGDYTFSIESVTGNYYEYELPTATVDGTSVTVTDNGNGTYTVENVTGELIITGKRTPKVHGVTLNGDNAANDGETATYGKDYTFTLADDLAPSTLPGYVYSIKSVTIGGADYTGYTADSRVYTIKGTDIIGDVVITIIQTATEPNQFNVTTTGNGAGAATLSGTVIDKDGNVTLTLAPEIGYVYSVTAGKYEVIKDGNAFTVSGITTAVEFEIVKTVDVSTAETSEYVTLNGSSMWLVKIGTAKIDGKVYTYNGQAMFWSEEYNAYVTLVVSAEAPTKESSDFDIISGSATVLSADEKDVNMSGSVDANDAQLVWNIYNTRYNDFTEKVTMEKFLRADVNGDGIVNTLDAAAIVNYILA